jgi:hypothetical protein
MRLAFFLAVLLLSIGSAQQAFACPPGTHPCGPVCCKG